MFQLRIHGRGGQGVVSAAEVLSLAAFSQGRHAQAFPSFGSERTGAPVVSFCRIEPIMQPDALIIQDPTLLHQVDVFSGLKPNGYVLINTSRSFEELGIGEIATGRRAERLCTVPATELALKHVGRPMPNIVLLGGFAALSGLLSLEALAAAVREKFAGKLADDNIAAATAAYEYIQAAMHQTSESAHA